MRATPLLHERRVVSEGAFVELVVWQVPSSVSGSAHAFKYRGQGDHKHIGREQTPYVFTTAARLLEDFWNDVDRWRS